MMKMMRSVPRRNEGKLSVRQRDFFCRTFHKFAIHDRLRGCQPASLFKHFGRDVDPNRFRDETRDGQCGMPCSSGYIEGSIGLNRPSELQ